MGSVIHLAASLAMRVQGVMETYCNGNRRASQVMRLNRHATKNRAGRMAQHTRWISFKIQMVGSISLLRQLFKPG